MPLHRRTCRMLALIGALSGATPSVAQTPPPPNPAVPAPSAGAPPRRAPPAEACQLAPRRPGQAQKPDLQGCDGIITPPNDIDPDMQAPAPAPHTAPMPVIPPGSVPQQPPQK